MRCRCASHPGCLWVKLVYIAKDAEKVQAPLPEFTQNGNGKHDRPRQGSRSASKLAPQRRDSQVLDPQALDSQPAHDKVSLPFPSLAFPDRLISSIRQPPRTPPNPLPDRPLAAVGGDAQWRKAASSAIGAPQFGMSDTLARVGIHGGELGEQGYERSRWVRHLGQSRGFQTQC